MNPKKLTSRFSSTITLNRKSPPLKGKPESQAIRRMGIVLEGCFNPQIQFFPAQDFSLLVLPKKAGGMTLGGVNYLELPNSTAMRVINPVTKKDEVYLITRGVRPYLNRVDIEGNQSPLGYISDALLFRLNEKKNKFEFLRCLIKSDQKNKFFFEDPRLSIVYSDKSRFRLLLSGTDYSVHVPGAKDPDITNRYVELKFDSRGIPTVPMNHQTGRPKFQNLSPFPFRPKGYSDYVFVDAKNGTIAQNEHREIVVRTRLRPDFSHPWVKKLAGSKSWQYGEQVFVFKNWDQFSNYDWTHALEDLFRPRQGVSSRIQPKQAMVILKNTQLRECFSDSRILRRMHKGMGPGTRPLRIRREHQGLWVSDDPKAEEIFVGWIPKEFYKTFPISENEVKFLTLDHEIRFFRDCGFFKRHYTMTAKLFDHSLSRLEAYYADIMQPKAGYERGINAGIVDLEHVYPMGIYTSTDSAGHVTLDIVAGVSDAHTALYRLDLIRFLCEMAHGSSRRKKGQVYLPPHQRSK